ncbi:MAG TPA: hypothetical protein VII38_02750 [Polyangia bacterium]
MTGTATSQEPGHFSAARVRTALLVIAGAAMLVHCWCFRGFVVDDAAISYTYARNLAHGHGLVLFPGGERVEAYSNFLWVALLGFGVRLGLDVFLVAKLFGAALGTAAVIGVGELTSALRGRRSILDGAAALLAASLTPIAYWSMSGLEGPLYLALIVWCAARLILERDHPDRRPLSGWLAAGIALTRPDGWLVAGAACLVRLAGDRRARSLVKWYAIAILPVLVHLGWRYEYYAYPFPNTFYVKVKNPFQAHELIDLHAKGWRYILGLFDRYHLAPAAALAALSLFRLRRLIPRWSVLALLAAVLFFPIYSRGDWMSEGRFVVAALPLVIALAVDGCERLAALVPRPQLSLGFAWGLTLLLAFHLMPTALANTRDRIGHYPVPVSYVAIRAHTYARVAAALAIAQPSALDGDLGGTSYYAGMPMVDLGALGDVTMAHHGLDPAAQREYVFGERRPTFMRIVGFWRNAHLQDYPEFKDRYSPLRVPGAGNEGLSIVRSAFTADGIDTRNPLARFEPEALALLGAKVQQGTVELWLLVESAKAKPLALHTAAGDKPIAIGDGYYTPADWQVGEVLHARLPRPAGASLALCGQTCFPLAEGASGAQPVAIPEPSPEARARLLSDHAWTILARIDADRGNPTLGRALLQRGLDERRAGELAPAFRDFLAAVRLDPRLSFARRDAEELRLLVKDAYDYRAQVALDHAILDFHLHPDPPHFDALVAAAKRAGAPRAAVRAHLATGLRPSSSALASDLAAAYHDLGLAPRQ